MRQIVQRICWNTNGWQHPSGDGRYESEGSYPHENGFGFEEWNFRTEDAFEDYVYGYMYNPPAIQKLQAQNIFDIYFWTMEPQTKQRLVVGMYKRASRAGEDEYKKLTAYFEKKGIFKRRARELEANLPDGHGTGANIQTLKKTNLLSIKCRRENVVRFSEPFPLEDLVTKSVGHRFTNYSDITKLKRKTAPTPTRSSQKSLNEDEYYRETLARRRKVIPQHNRLSNSFCTWLRKNGIASVQEKDWIDVGFKLGQRTCLAEIKICQEYGTRKAIREAMGQVLEYNYYPGRSPADLWLIVLDQTPTPSDKQYIRQVREALNLPITVAWVDGSSFTFERKLQRL
ncbi:hypothetical protein [Microvirga solisilvae]|uniref:hypothetical protein n=1 Tax=Microvirga solisilvae TaxID=2919498 RepID=UPI001FAF8523|nr:hypothetical protein [Microvirga solisilvae]